MFRSEAVRDVCDSKILYDTEFEAQVAAARKTWKANVYKCPGTNHYHLTHANKSQRIGHGALKVECPNCKKLINRRGSQGHIKRCKG